MNYVKLVEDNLLLVHSCAHKMKGRGIEYDELYSAGCEGLVKAAKKFDKSLGFSFSTYAVPVIFGEIKRLFRENSTVKVSRTLKDLSLKASRIKQELSVKLNREPTVKELAQALEVSPEKIALALESTIPALSLTCDDDSMKELQVATDENEDKLLTTLSINSVMSTLDDKDRTLIVLRFYKDKTQSQTAKELGMTQVQVSRRERTLLEIMRKRLIC